MPATSTGDRVRGAVGIVGELLITAGVVVGLFAVYTLFWTGVETANQQEALQEQFSSAGREADPDATQEPAPDDSGPEPLSGDAYARLTIPRLGDGWGWIVLQGVDLATLTRGPGHYPETVDPGEVGNFAVAGHRTTYGEPFANLDRLQVGDEVRVERAGMMHTYAVTESFITDPSNISVLAPVPGQPGVEADDAVQEVSGGSAVDRQDYVFDASLQYRHDVVDPQGENAEHIDDIYPVIGPYLGLDGLTG